MARKGHSPEQILGKLRQIIEVAVATGKTIALAVREAGITDQTYYRWRTEYGGLGIDQARRMKQLEQSSPVVGALISSSGDWGLVCPRSGLPVEDRVVTNTAFLLGFAGLRSRCRSDMDIHPLRS